MEQSNQPQTKSNVNAETHLKYDKQGCLQSSEKELRQSCPLGKNRAKMNWSKVRSILLKKKKQYESEEKNNLENERNVLGSMKNKLYNLFQKQITLANPSSTKLIQKQNLSQQTLIRTLYKIQFNDERTLEIGKQEQKIQSIKLVTETPLPSVSKIISATQNDKEQTKSKVVDTTGFWIWQAEEIMTYFIIKNYEQFCNKEIKNTSFPLNFNSVRNVLELGAGSSGLASLVIAKLINYQISRSNQSMNQTRYNAEISITDGKIQNVQYIENNIHLNSINPPTNRVQNQDRNNSGQKNNHQFQINNHAEFLSWGTQIKRKFDLILAADCLFFEQFHYQLINTLHSSMHHNSVALFINPSRGKSMDNFIQKAKFQGFQIETINFKDQKFQQEEYRVKSLPSFDSERHIFHFIKLKKIQKIQ